MGQEGYGKNMPEKDTTRQSSMLDTEQATLLYPSSAIAALEQMYQQSRFEAQCCFVSSLITAIIGTILILSTILFLLLFKDTAQENESGHITLIVANIINGAIQHLIVSQRGERTPYSRATALYYYHAPRRRRAQCITDPDSYECDIRYGAGTTIATVYLSATPSKKPVQKQL